MRAQPDPDWRLGPGISSRSINFNVLHQSTGSNPTSVLDSKRHGLKLSMTRRRSEGSEGRGSRRYSSSSESSLSSGSDIESDVDSDVSSDGLKLGIDGKSAQQKFKRLRRIFLNRPTKRTQKEDPQRRRLSPGGRGGAQLGRKSPRTIAERRHSSHRRRSSTSSSSSSDERALDKPPAASAVRPLQTAVDQHMNSLREQMKRHSAQRDSTANQVQSMLDQAVDELEFLKKQEERALESQVRLIRESYALRLEVFQQQYLNKVAEIEDEMYASIQKRQEESDATVLSAARKLQDQTQHALLKDVATVNGETIEELLDSSSFSTASSSASQSKMQTHGHIRPLHRDPLGSSRQPPQVVPVSKQASPVSKQRAKLQALEEKLAAFSPESLARVKNELAAPVRRTRAERPHVKPNRTPTATSDRFLGSPKAGFQEKWRASPLSPLRQGPSYWKNGISLEARGRTDNFDPTGNIDQTGATLTTSPASLLSRRFLRPEEEEELRHLQASIGRAKDWMARNNGAGVKRER